MSASRELTLNDVLNTDELDALNFMEHLIEQNTGSSDERLINKLKSISAESIVLFTNKSLILKRFCENNSTLRTYWEEQLTKPSNHYPYPSFDLISIDKSKTKAIFVFDHYVAAAYFSAALDPKYPNRPEMLSKACEIGLFNALVFRAEMNQKDINENKGNKETHITELEEDAKKIANYYLGYGCAKAASFLMNLAPAFTDNPKRLNDCWKQISEYIFCAFLLKEHKESNEMVLALTKSRYENLDSVLPSLGIERWEVIEGTIKKLISEQDYKDSLSKAEKRIAPALERAVIYDAMTAENTDDNDSKSEAENSEAEDESSEVEITFHEEGKAETLPPTSNSPHRFLQGSAATTELVSNTKKNNPLI